MSFVLKSHNGQKNQVTAQPFSLPALPSSSVSHFIPHKDQEAPVSGSPGAGCWHGPPTGSWVSAEYAVPTVLDINLPVVPRDLRHQGPSASSSSASTRLQEPRSHTALRLRVCRHRSSLPLSIRPLGHMASPVSLDVKDGDMVKSVLLSWQLGCPLRLLLRPLGHISPEQLL